MGWSATTSPTSSPATARTRRVPKALTDYIKGREGYDYNEHGQAGNVHTRFVPDEIVDRFCVLGPVEEHIRGSRSSRRWACDQFAVYLQHDDEGRDPAGVRREGHPGHRRHGAGEVVTGRVRRTWMFALSLVLVAALWELYKWIGPQDGGKLFGLTVLPRANDTATSTR